MVDQVNVEWSINQALNALDELIAYANRPETVLYLESQPNRRFVSMIQTRASLLESALLAREETERLGKVKMVHRTSVAPDRLSVTPA